MKFYSFAAKFLHYYKKYLSLLAVLREGWRINVFQAFGKFEFNKEAKYRLYDEVFNKIYYNKVQWWPLSILQKYVDYYDYAIDSYIIKYPVHVAWKLCESYPNANISYVSNLLKKGDQESAWNYIHSLQKEA